MLEDRQMRELVRSYIGQQMEEYETMQFAVGAEPAMQWQELREDAEAPAQILEGFLQRYELAEDRF